MVEPVHRGLLRKTHFFVCHMGRRFSWYGLGSLSNACCVKHSQALFSIRSYSSFQGWPLIVRIDCAEQFVLRWAHPFKARMEYVKLKPAKHTVERVKNTFLQIKKKKKKSRDGHRATICVLAVTPKPKSETSPRPCKALEVLKSSSLGPSCVWLALTLWCTVNPLWPLYRSFPGGQVENRARF